MKKGPLSPDALARHRECVLAGQARAVAKGKLLGRPSRYSDVLIHRAIAQHDEGLTWKQIAVALGISRTGLMDRLRTYRRQTGE